MRQSADALDGASQNFRDKAVLGTWLLFAAVFGILHALLPKDGKSTAENRDRK
jgi:hypothetical protein